MSRYKDIRTNLDVHPVNGDLMVLHDEAAISTQIKNLVFTDFYERPWDPQLGAGVPQTLFDNFGPDSEYLIKTRITETINKYVNRARLVDVLVVYDNLNGYNCTIVYQPVNVLEPVTLRVILTRTR